MTLEEKIAAVVNSPQRRLLFFSKLTEPKLVSPLVNAGYFASAPKVVEDPPGTFSHPPWPEGQYLVRMAEKIPAEVAIILAKLKTNGNLHAIRLRLEAFQRMPGLHIRPHMSIILADLDREGEEAGLHIVGIASQLWAAGLRDEALGLVQWAYRVQSTPEAADSVFPARTGLDASGFVSHEIIEDFLQPRLREDPQRVIDVTINALQQYLAANHPNQAGPRRHDGSFIWQPDLDKRDEYGEAQAQLLWFLQYATKAATMPETAAAIVKQLEGKAWSAFRRVALALLADHAKTLRTDALQRILDPATYDDHTVRPEYVRLLRALAPTLSPDEVEKYVAMAEATIDPERERKVLRKQLGREPSDAEVEGVRANELRDRLAPVRDVLSPEARRRFDGWVSKYGEPVFVDSAVKMGPTVIGSQPEPAVDEPAFSDLPAALRKIVLEHPEPRHLEWGRENTHDRVTMRAQQELGSILDKPELLDEFPALYQPDIVRGVAQSATSPEILETKFPERALAFLEKAGTLPGGEGSDPGLILNIQRIIEAILPKFPKESSQDQLQRLWNLVRGGIGTPYPRGDNASTTRDHYTDGINSGPGKALENAVEFSLLLRRTKDLPTGLIRGPLADEVRQVLRHQGNLEQQPLLAVHAVASRLFPWIKSFDAANAANAVEQLYPGNDPNKPAWRAAWDPHVVYNRVYRDLWTQLRPKVHVLLDKTPAWLEDDQQVLEHTAWHLLTYALADIAKDDDLAKLVASPSWKLRREVLERLGEQFRNDAEKDQTDRIARAKTLAEKLVEKARTEKESSKSLGATTSILSATHLPLLWRLQLGNRAADAGIEFDEGPHLIETLLQAAGHERKQAFALLARILGAWHDKGKGRARWRVYHEREGIMRALKQVQVDDLSIAPEAFQVAEALIDMGLLEFREQARRLKP